MRWIENAQAQKQIKYWDYGDIEGLLSVALQNTGFNLGKKNLVYTHEKSAKDAEKGFEKFNEPTGRALAFLLIQCARYETQALWSSVYADCANPKNSDSTSQAGAVVDWSGRVRKNWNAIRSTPGWSEKLGSWPELGDVVLSTEGLKPFNPSPIRAALRLSWADVDELPKRLAEAVLHRLLFDDLGLSNNKILDSAWEDVDPELSHGLVQEMSEAVEDCRCQTCDSSSWSRVANTVHHLIRVQGLSFATFAALDFDASAAARLLLSKPLSTTGKKSTTWGSTLQPPPLEFDLTKRLYSLDKGQLCSLRASWRENILRRFRQGSPSVSVDVARAASRVLLQLAHPNFTHREYGAPSFLLHPNSQITPFVEVRDAQGDPGNGARTLTDQLVDWAVSGTGLQVALLTGPGGSGKTRLVLEVFRRSPGAICGFLDVNVANELPEINLRYLGRDNERVLVAVDYAETLSKSPKDPGLLVRLLGQLMAPPVRTVTVLLLARTRGDWWSKLERDRYVGSLLKKTRHIYVSGDELSDERRCRIFFEALRAFARVLNLPLKQVSPDLSGPPFENVLFIHCEAYAAVYGESSPEDPMAYVLLRERRLWEEMLWPLNATDISQAMALVTLLGGLGKFQAIAAFERHPAFRDGQVASDLATKLHDLYHRRGLWLPALEPDLLGERLVAEELRDPVLLEWLALDGASLPQLKQCLTVLARIAQRDSTQEHWLEEILRPRLTAETATLCCQVAQETGQSMAKVLEGLLTEKEDTEVALSILLAAYNSSSLRSLAVTAARLVPNLDRARSFDFDPLPQWLLSQGKAEEALRLAEETLASLASLLDCDKDTRFGALLTLCQALMANGQFDKALEVALEAKAISRTERMIFKAKRMYWHLLTHLGRMEEVERDVSSTATEQRWCPQQIATLNLVLGLSYGHVPVINSVGSTILLSPRVRREGDESLDYDFHNDGLVIREPLGRHDDFVRSVSTDFVSSTVGFANEGEWADAARLNEKHLQFLDTEKCSNEAPMFVQAQMAICAHRRATPTVALQNVEKAIRLAKSAGPCRELMLVQFLGLRAQILTKLPERSGEAHATLDEVRSIIEKSLCPRHPLFILADGTCWLQLGWLRESEGNLEESAEAYAHAVAILSQAPTRFAVDEVMAAAYLSLAGVQSSLGKQQQALDASWNLLLAHGRLAEYDSRMIHYLEKAAHFWIRCGGAANKTPETVSAELRAAIPARARAKVGIKFVWQR